MTLDRASRSSDRARVESAVIDPHRAQVLAGAFALLAFAVLTLTSCARHEIQVAVDASVPDAGCRSPCGAECCSADQACVDGHCGCASKCDGRQCGPDGCGGSCGQCAEGEICNAQSFRCDCLPEDELALCAAAQVECGPLSARDRCGAIRDIDDCGACAAGETCTAARRCQCDPETDAVFCRRRGTECGALSGDDNCGARRVLDTCGACAVDRMCSSGLCQPCAVETDEAFCLRYHKNCGLVRAPDSCGHERTVASCGTCVTPDVCDDQNVCNLPGAPTNDRCFGALDIRLDAAGHAVLQVFTDAAVDDGAGSCASSPGRDVVHRLVLEGTTDLEITAALPAGSTSLPAIFLRRACDSEATEVACGVADAPASTFHLRRFALPRGEYFLWIEGAQTASEGALNVELTARQVSGTPSNDLCVNATELDLDSGAVSVEGTTTGAADDETGSCALMDGADVAYRFTTTQTRSVHFRATGRGSTASLIPGIHVRTGCGGPSQEIGCGMGSLFLNDLAAGSYVVFVDGTSGSRGEFTLDVRASLPSDNDTCATARQLTFGAQTRSTTVVGDTSNAHDNVRSDCDYYLSGPDLVYWFEVPAGRPQKVEITLAALPGSSLLPSVLVSSGCEQRRVDLKCQGGSASGQPTQLSFRSLPQGTYYLFVDGSATYPNPGQFLPTMGAFMLTVGLSDPPTGPANDSCSGAARLTFDPSTHVAKATGTTVDAVNDTWGSCGGGRGGDVVYRFELPQAASVRATVTPDAASPGFWPVLLLREADCAGAVAGSEKACAIFAAAAASAAVASLPQGSYYLVVDAVGESEGGFELEVAWASPVTNDSCPGVVPVQLDLVTESATILSDTGGGADDVTSGCNSYTGKDLVWSLTVPAAGGARTVVIDAIGTAGSSFIPNISVRRQCDFQSTEIACASAVGDGSAAHLRLNKVPAGTTLFLWVDGAGPTRNGPFTLGVQLLTPPTPPAFDTCSGATPLQFDGSGWAHASGSTDDANDDTSGTCGALDGPDVVYSLHLDSTASVSALVARDNASTAFNAAVYIRSACASSSASDEAACAATTTGSSLAVAPSLPEGDYVVIVDGANATSGGFTLDVRHAPAIDNFTCATAQPLPIDPRTGRAFAASDSTGAGDSTSSSCVPYGGRDLVWALEVPNGARQDLAITVAPAPGTPFGNTFSVSMRRDCARSVSELGCASSHSGAATLNVPRVQPGTYYLWVQSDRSTFDGPFTLGVVASPTTIGGPANDLCAAAPELQFLSGTAEATGTTEEASNDGDGSCWPGSGGDVVYWFQLAGTMDVTVTVTAPTGSGLQPAVYLRSSCGQASSEVACGFSQDPTLPLVVTATRLPQGAYYLWVDTALTYAWAHGAFSVQVAQSSPTPPPANDNCAGTVVPVAIDSTTHRGSTTGSTAAAMDDYAGTCATSGDAHTGAEVVYSFQIGSPADVTAKVTRASTSPSFRPAVYIRSACANATAGGEHGCASDAGSGVATAIGRSLAPGVWYVIVDGINGTSGGFSLELTENPATSNDGCATALGLTFDGAGKATVRGDTTNAGDDSSAGCSGQTGPDVVYVFDTYGMGAQQMTATMSFDTPTNWPALYLRTDCASPGIADEVTCGRSNTNPLVITADLPEGTYYLWADTAYPTDKGPFSLEVQLSSLGSPPANDVCRNAQSLQFTSGVAQATGSTRPATNDYTSSCGSMGGGDVVYEVQLWQDAMLSATVTADGSTPGFSPGVYIRSACGSNAVVDQLACATAQSGVATVTSPALPAGDYFIIVDGDGHSTGDFTLQVNTGDPLRHDTCAAPQVLDFDATTHEATVTADLRFASASGDGSCDAGSGPDLVYQLTVGGQGKTLAAQLWGTGALRPNLYLRRDCANASSEIACSLAATTAASASIAVPRLAPGTYYLWVDAYSGTSVGPFTLQATLTEPPAAPANDGCGAPTPLDFAQGATTTAVGGDTTYAADDVSPSCAAAGGADVVYSLTLSSAQRVTARVSRASGAPGPYEPVVSIRGTACGDPAQGSVELACGRPSGSGTSAATLGNAAQGTYWIWVDGAGLVTGAFTLEVELAAPNASAPANEACGTAQAITFTNGLATVDATAITGAVQDDSSGSCSAAGGDVVYTFNLAQTRRVTAKVMAATGFAPAIYVRRSCASVAQADELSCNASATPGGTATAVVTTATPGDYWVWVDAGAPGSTGAFILEVKAELPISPPTNDNCNSVLTLQRGVPVTSDTSSAADDYQANAHVCSRGPDSHGPDLVFVYRAPSSAGFTITATPLSAWDLVLWTHSGNACYRPPGTCEGISNVGGVGVGESVAITNASGGMDYWIFVDGLDATNKGAFTIEIQ